MILGYPVCILGFRNFTFFAKMASYRQLFDRVVNVVCPLRGEITRRCKRSVLTYSCSVLCSTSSPWIMAARSPTRDGFHSILRQNGNHTLQDLRNIATPPPTRRCVQIKRAAQLTQRTPLVSRVKQMS